MPENPQVHHQIGTVPFFFFPLLVADFPFAEVAVPERARLYLSPFSILRRFLEGVIARVFAARWGCAGILIFVDLLRNCCEPLARIFFYRVNGCGEFLRKLAALHISVVFVF